MNDVMSMLIPNRLGIAEANTKYQLPECREFQHSLWRMEKLRIRNILRFSVEVGRKKSKRK